MYNKKLCFVIAIFCILVGLLPTLTEHKQKEIDKEYSESISKQIESETTTTMTNNTTTTKKLLKKAEKKSGSIMKVTNYSKNEIKEYLHEQVLAYGWTEKDYNNAVKLINRESGFNPNAYNKKSTACGLGQAMPCSKTNSKYKKDWKYQVRWFLDYCKSRYGNPTKAWKHSQNKGWY